MKNFILVCMAVLLAATALSCSGISKEDYDAVVAERDSARVEREALQRDLNSARNEAGRLESQLIEAGNEKSALEIKASSFENQAAATGRSYDSLKEKITRAKRYADILDTFLFVPGFEMTVAETLQLTRMIQDTGNSELESQWTAYLESGSEDDRKEWIFTTWEGTYGVFK